MPDVGLIKSALSPSAVSSVGIGAGSGAAVGALATLFTEKPTIRKALRNALIGSAGGAAIGGSVHVLGEKQDAPVAPLKPLAPPAPPSPGVISSPDKPQPTGMSLPGAALSGLAPGVGPGLHGASAGGPQQSLGSGLASYLGAALPLRSAHGKAIASGGKLPGSVILAALAGSAAGATGAAALGNHLRGD